MAVQNVIRIFIAASLLLASSLHAQTIKTYDISGDNAAELIASMKANGPNGFWAQAHNSWRYNYRFSNSTGKYTLTSLVITRKVEVTMPNWPGYTYASSCRKKNWDAMYWSLKNHEDYHISLGDPVEVLLRQAIVDIEPIESKDDLAGIVERTAQKVFDENKLTQRQYDSETKHGKNDPTDPVILKSCG